ncbi:glycosyl hydrolase family 18 protein [Pedobacter sp. GR22-6]|uniref:glycosyl hydrolase family 18 protein n=1 Tax=Pedobacter sp. GR22-6 TaxID=3127957 RepID=UPI00307F1A2F
MKKIKILAYILFSFILFIGCKEDEVAVQERDHAFTPRILGGDIASLFPNPNASQVLDVGEKVDFSAVQFSPAGKVSVVWKVDDVQVSTGEKYIYTATTAGDHRIKVEASYNGTMVSRYKDVFVLAAAGAAFTPKAYNKVTMSYIGENGDISAMNWNNITHVTFKAALVNAAGILDLSKGETGRKTQEIATKAHLNGVYALLGVSAALSANGWNVYDSNTFGTALKNVTQRGVLVQDIKKYLTDRSLDGVDVMMADVGNTVEATTTANIAATILFINELRAALGASKIITLTVPVNYTHSNYTAANLTNVNWVNVRAFESGLNTGVGRPLGNPSGYQYMVTSAEIWKAKMPADKLVIGIPAMGLRYTAVDANGNNLNFTSFNYIPYKDILALSPAAFDKEKLDLTPAPLAIYYNGVPMVTQKAQYIKATGYLGAYIWQGDFDVNGPNSLTLAISNALK